jgi:Fungal specific transcription factor domain
LIFLLPDSGQKPFQCTVCSKGFGRKDVLSRHLRLHEKYSSGSAVSESPHLEIRQLQESSTATQWTPSSADNGRLLPSPANEDDRLQQERYDDTRETVLRPQQPWCNSEDLLELLTSDTGNNWPLARPLVNFRPTEGDGQVGPNLSGVECAPGQQAMHQMSTLIFNLSSNLMSEIEGAGITSAFLDTCIHLFFEKFNSAFPILHSATFVVKEASNPLLLNIVAVGSLFIGHATAKGETLWRLAHTAVATSWQALMATRGPRDECNGIQLVLTALIGQIYAMLSKNEALRMTCQTFHGLGFFWACQSGMYEVKPFSAADVPSLESTEDMKLHAWRVWAAREVQIRAILGHYLLDGQISQFSGQQACVRHVTNSLHTLISDAAFAAPTADAWITEMKGNDQAPPTFREFFNSILSAASSNTHPKLSGFSIQVVLEGLQSLVSDTQTTDGPSVGTPTAFDIVSALFRLRDEYILPMSSLSAAKTELLIRWHTILLNLATPYPAMCQRLCALFGVEQSLYATLKHSHENWSLETWSQSRDGLRALLHAMAIQELVESLPLGRCHAIHLPAAVFATATIYSARCMAGVPSVTTPQHVSWHDVWAPPIQSPATLEWGGLTDTARFFNNESSNVGTKGTTRILLYDLNTVQATLHSLSSRWGISHEMDQVLHRWTTIVNVGSVALGI